MPDVPTYPTLLAVLGGAAGLLVSLLGAAALVHAALRWQMHRLHAEALAWDALLTRQREQGVRFGYDAGHALGTVAGEARLRREWALARLAVEAKHAPPLTTSEDDAENGDWLAAEQRLRRRMGGEWAA